MGGSGVQFHTQTINPIVDETSGNVGLGARTTEVKKNFFRPAEIAAGPALAARVPYERQSGRENSARSPGKAEHEFFDFRSFGLSHDKNRVETRKRRKSKKSRPADV